MNKPTSRLFLVVALLVVTVGCGGGGESAAGGGGGAPARGMPAMGVKITTLQATPVEQLTEFVGTIKSRQSTNIQPQVEGFLTRIRVKSGDRVAPGATLMEIDSRLQQATLQSLESVRTQREIDVAYAKQEAERSERLLKAGAASQMDSDRAINALKASEAQLRTVQEQIRASQTDIAYYNVTSPTGGIVGDIPVRVGDRVTKSTLLTTVDSNAGLEVYINVPVQQATRLRPGLVVRLLDDAGTTIAEEKVNFVSPSVDTQTQTVLVKTPVTKPGTLRTDQYVRALLVWTTEPGLTVPLTSVTRINGLWFAFVAEPGEGGKGLVARQRQVQLGPVVGNNYTVASGLKAGDRLITEGVQKIRDGAPVAESAQPSASGGA